MAEAQQVYVIHSGVRKRHTRALRMQNAMAYRAKFVQKIGGGDIVVRRSRPVKVPESVLQKHLEEIKGKAKLGLLEVRTTGGQLVDLGTMKVSAPKATPPKPKPADKSVAADKPGPMEHKRMYPESRAITEPVESPTVLQDELPEGEEAETNEFGFGPEFETESETLSSSRASKKKKSSKR